MVNRRNFLKSASFLTLGGLVAGKAEALQAATPVRTETTAKKKYRFADLFFRRRVNQRCSCRNETT